MVPDDIMEGPIYTERQCQCCDVTVTLIELLRFLNKQASRSKNGLQPELVRYDTTVNVDARNQSLTLSVYK